MTGALERIEASRARLRLAMMPPPPPAKSEPADWQAKLLQIPLVGAVIESVQSWWTQHPMRPASRVAAEATGAAVQPIADRHPIALVAVAALLGAAFAWSRPWRWLFRSALFAGLLPQLATRAMTNLPIESWMTMLGSVLSKRGSSQPTVGEPAGAPATG